MLTLLDIFKIRNIALGKYKLHLATEPNQALLQTFLEGKFQRYQEEQHRLNFQCDHIVGLIDLYNDAWLFAGVYKVLGVGKGTNIEYLYQTELMPGLDDLIGRVIVHFERPSRQSYVWGDRYGHLLEVVEIKPQRMSIREFPGYNKVIVTYRELGLIVAQQEPSWKAALENVQGVYLIADRSNGKLYVGSAYGGEGIWQRWMSYALTGHGGNKELITLIESEGLKYCENFQYSILEIADIHTMDELIIERENYWKNALLSRKPHGYNVN
jgi:hypothetical protein